MGARQSPAQAHHVQFTHDARMLSLLGLSDAFAQP